MPKPRAKASSLARAVAVGDGSRAAARMLRQRRGERRVACVSGWPAAASAAAGPPASGFREGPSRYGAPFSFPSAAGGSRLPYPRGVEPLHLVQPLAGLVPEFRGMHPAFVPYSQLSQLASDAYMGQTGT